MHLHSIPPRGQAPAQSLGAEVLDHLVSLSSEQLSPLQSDRLFHEVGKRLGREAWRRYRLAYRLDRGPTIKDLVQCITGLEETWKWPCTILQQGEDQVSLTVPPLPFGPHATVGTGHRPNIWRVTSGLLEGIAEEAFGFGKVCLLPDEGLGHTHRRLALYLHTRPQKGSGIARRSRRSQDDGDELAQLSSREHQVLQCLGEGLTNKEIAGRLGISVRTVEGHVSRICVKLDLRRRADLIRCSLRHKLATL